MKAGKKMKTNSLSIQKLLYEHPLYDAGSDINVLAYGENKVIYSFVNYALQLAQFPNTKITVTIASDRLKAKEHYEKNAQKSFYDFIKFDGQADRKTHLAEIKFKSKESVDFSDYNYVFIADDDCMKNRELSDSLENKVVAYLCEKEDENNKSIPVFPVYDLNDISSQLSRMAFNVHLIWGSPDKSIKDHKKDFEQEYNYLSSCSNALSIKYKLHSLGLYVGNDIEQCRRTANEYSNTVKESEVRFLQECEHNRWIIEKVLDGWTGVEKDDVGYIFDHCVKNQDWKNKEDKIHPCIAPFSALEKISRDLKEYVKSLAVNENAINNYLEQLGKLPIDDDLLFKFKFNVESIINGDKAATKQYEYLKDKILRSCDGIQDDNVIEKIDNDIFYYNLHNEEKNFADLDRYFIVRIPFILSYNTDIHYVAKLKTKNGFVDLDMLKNPMLLRPCKVTVVGDNNYKESIEELFRSNYIDAKINFVDDENSVSISESTVINKEGFSVEFRERNESCLIDNIEWIKYIPKRNIRLSIDDIIRYNGIQRVKNESVAILNRKIRNAIFTEYYNDTSKWNQFVGELMNQEVKLFFEYTPNTGNGKESVYFSVERSLRNNLNKILVAIKSSDENFSAGYKDNDMLHVTGSKEVLNKLADLIYKDYHYLYDGCKIKQYCYREDKENPGTTVLSDYVTESRVDKTVCFAEDSLVVKKNENPLFTRLTSKNVFIKIRNSDNYVYANRAVKNIFTKEGNILENIVYTDAVKSNYFDDIITGFQFRYTDENGKTVSHEIDCVLIRGDVVLLVECKNKTNISSDTDAKSAYTQILSATEKFVNGKIKKCVIHYDRNSNHIPDYSESNIITINNKLFIIRGQIAKTLKSIADGDYDVDSKGIFMPKT